LHKIWICGGEISVGSIARVVIDEPSCASTPDGTAQKRSNAAILFEKSKEEAPRKFGQKLWEKFTQNVGEYCDFSLEERERAIVGFFACLSSNFSALAMAMSQSCRHLP
jgi:hypothetical protein